MFPVIPRLFHPLAAIPAGSLVQDLPPHMHCFVRWDTRGKSMLLYGRSWRPAGVSTRRSVRVSRKRLCTRSLSELRSCGLAIERERQVRIWYGSFVVGKHSLDLIVERTVVIELKATQALAPIYGAQLRSYLRATVPAEFSSTSVPWLFNGK